MSLNVFKQSFFLNTKNLSKVPFCQLARVRKMTSYEKASEDVIFTVAALGDHEAQKERLVREIMAVDKVERIHAKTRFEEIKNENRKGLFSAMLPYRIGILLSSGSALLSIPLIFHEETVMYFNHHFVTADIPEPKDLETCLEVGSFSWNWMEPVLGTVSFALLCLQFARNQIRNIGAKPFTSWFKHRRSKKLISQFPQYDKFILRSFSEGDPLSV
ncbi:hypothetical protein HDU92_001394 [Lobulomyces angularis]|nr:hypothetical protein HDU92_001394 [Lobulomyces angularis]